MEALGLNEYVERELSGTLGMGVDSRTNTAVSIMKRRRLTTDEEDYLEQIFAVNPFLWDKKLKERVAKSLGL